MNFSTMSPLATPPRKGLLGRFGWQTRPPSPAPSVVSGTSTEASQAQRVDVLAVISENAELRAELEKMQRRCGELEFQSQLNQDMMQECVAASKKDVDHLSTENQRLKERYDHLLTTSNADRDTLQHQLVSAIGSNDALVAANQNLKIRREELTAQSQADKDILRIISTDLASKTAEVRSLRSSLKQFGFLKPSEVPAKDAEIKAHKATITTLESSLTDLQESYMRLQAMGCVPVPPSNELDLSRRIQTLEHDNTVLQDKLDTRIADTKARVLEYADELNDLTDELRLTSADASCNASQLKILSSQFRTLKAEYDALSSEVDVSRRTSKRFTKELLSHSQRNSIPDTLSAQLAAVQATAVEREKLVERFREQHEALARAVRMEAAEKKELVDKVEEMYHENKADRKRFERGLKRRDGRIGELEREIRGLVKEREGKSSVDFIRSTFVE